MKTPFISRVEITNFRSFKNLQLDLEPTAVVVGENAAGKSNLLEALRLALDPSLPDSARRLRGEDFWDGLPKPFAGHIIEIKVFIKGFEENEGASAILSDCVVSPKTALLTYQFRPRKRIELAETATNGGEGAGIAPDELTDDDYEYLVFGGADEKHVVGNEIRKWLAITLLPALRDAEGDIQSWRKSPLRPLLERTRKLIPEAHLEQVREDLDSAKAKLLEVEPFSNLIEAVNARIRHLAGPIHAVKTDLDFAASEPDQLIKSLRVFLDQPRTRPLSDASLGTANILFLALLLEELEMKQKAKEIVSTILAIEEPEAHLHPQLQRLLFRYFLGRSHSILVTTHSPNIVAVAPLQSVVLLRNIGDETVGFTSRNLSLTPEARDDLQRYLDVTRGEMFFARAVIFVEGPAEQFLVPAFANAYLESNFIGSSLDDFGISVCSVNGTDFGPFRTLLSPGGLAVPNVVITDGDPYESNGTTKRNGLKRGIRLVHPEDLRPEMQATFDAGQETETRTALATEGVFVGEHTLELDLLPSVAGEMKAAYRELRISTAASARFDAAVDEALAGDEQAKAQVLYRIESLGKGRFAQRLASKIQGQPAPEYIQNAIQFIVQQVSNGDIKPE
ncbi:MAG: AAA family ATPase [Verrucomicrobia subdivision 3 bacterium]|nr:AAA family ATPase [Limisphaerales bacterium]